LVYPGPPSAERLETVVSPQDVGVVVDARHSRGNARCKDVPAKREAHLRKPAKLNVSDMLSTSLSSAKIPRQRVTAVPVCIWRLLFTRSVVVKTLRPDFYQR